MPREAARLFLRVTDVRAERLQEITLDDCVREGVIDPKEKDESVTNLQRGIFSAVWDTYSSKCGVMWNDNPWVWVYTFERVEVTR
jgi:hypothetical protein